MTYGRTEFSFKGKSMRSVQTKKGKAFSFKGGSKIVSQQSLLYLAIGVLIRFVYRIK